MLVFGLDPSLPSVTDYEINKTRVIFHMFVAAATTLLENIISNPTHRRAQSDLKLIEPLLALLSALAKDGKNEEVATMYLNCGQIFDKTSQIVQNANGAEKEERRKIVGKQNEKESLEEFIRRIESVSAGYEDEDDTVMQGVQTVENEIVGSGFPYLGASGFEISRAVW
jgi:hypothetical protein